jgi:hypothetical protein
MQRSWGFFKMTCSGGMLWTPININFNRERLFNVNLQPIKICWTIKKCENPRVAAPSTLHHVTYRGGNRLQLTFLKYDYKAYLELIFEWWATYSVQILAPDWSATIIIPERRENQIVVDQISRSWQLKRLLWKKKGPYFSGIQFKVPKFINLNGPNLLLTRFVIGKMLRFCALTLYSNGVFQRTRLFRWKK